MNEAFFNIYKRTFSKLHPPIVAAFSVRRVLNGRCSGRVILRGNPPPPFPSPRACRNRRVSVRVKNTWRKRWKEGRQRKWLPVPSAEWNQTRAAKLPESASGRSRRHHVAASSSETPPSVEPLPPFLTQRRDLGPFVPGRQGTAGKKKFLVHWDLE